VCAPGGAAICSQKCFCSRSFAAFYAAKASAAGRPGAAEKGPEGVTVPALRGIATVLATVKAAARRLYTGANSNPRRLIAFDPERTSRCLGFWCA
jgi:hypothetical protein